MSRWVTVLLTASVATTIYVQSPPVIQTLGATPAVIPPRDPSQKLTTAAFRGRVVAADNGVPLRRAQVRASAPELRETRFTMTDAQGRYELKDQRWSAWTAGPNQRPR